MFDLPQSSCEYAFALITKDLSVRFRKEGLGDVRFDLMMSPPRMWRPPSKPKDYDPLGEAILKVIRNDKILRQKHNL